MIATNKDLAVRVEKLEHGQRRIGSVIDVLVDEIEHMKKLPPPSKRKIGFDLWLFKLERFIDYLLHYAVRRSVQWMFLLQQQDLVLEFSGETGTNPFHCHECSCE